MKEKKNEDNTNDGGLCHGYLSVIFYHQHEREHQTPWASKESEEEMS